MSFAVVDQGRWYQIDWGQHPAAYAMNAVVPATRKTARYGASAGSVAAAT